MALTVADLVARLRLDTSGFTNGVQKTTSTTNGLKRTFQQTDGEAKKVQSTFGTLKARLGEVDRGFAQAGVSTGALGGALRLALNPITLVATAIASVGVAAGLAAKSIATNANEVRNLMAVSGLGAEAADNLADTMRLLGVDSATLTTAMFRLGQEIDAGGAALSRLGISIFKTKNELKTEGELFLEVRDRISQMGTTTARSAALQDLFTRSGRGLASVMALSNEEFERFRKIAEATSPWNDRLQQQGTALSRAWTLLAMTFDGLTIRIGAFVVGAATKLIEWIATAIGWFNQAIDVVTKFFGLFPEGAAKANQAGEAMAKIPAQIASQLAKLNAREILQAQTAGIDVISQMNQQAVELGRMTAEEMLSQELDLIDARTREQQAYYTRSAADLKTSGDQFGVAMKELGIEHAAAMQTLYNDRQKTLFQIDLIAKKSLDTQLDWVTDFVKSSATLIESQTDTVRRQYAEQLGALVLLHSKGLASETQFQQGRLRLVQQYEIATLEAERAIAGERVHLLELRNTQTQDMQTLALRALAEEQRAVGDTVGYIVSQFKLAVRATGDSWDALAQLGRETAQAIQQAFSDFFFDAFTGQLENITDVFRSFLNSLVRAISNFLASQVVRQFLAILGGGGAGAVAGAAGSGGTLEALGLTGATIGGLLAATGGAGGILGGTTGATISTLAALGHIQNSAPALMAVSNAVQTGGSVTGALSNAGVVGVAGAAGGAVMLAGVATGNEDLTRGGNALGSLGLLASGSSTLAGVGVVINVGTAIYTLSSGEGNQNAAIGTLVGTVIGGVVGSAVPAIGTVVGAAIGGAFGGFIGGFFKEGLPHEAREAREFRDIVQGNEPRLKALESAQSPQQLAALLLNMTTDPASVKRGGRFQFSAGGQQLTAGNVGQFGQLLRDQPGSFQAELIAGVSPELRESLNQPVEAFVRAFIEAFKQVEQQVAEILRDLTKETIQPASMTAVEALGQMGRNFGLLLDQITANAEKAIDSAMVEMLTLTDPNAIIQQVATIRQLIDARYQGEVDLVKQWAGEIAQLTQAWTSLRQSVSEQIFQLKIGQFGPTNPAERLGLTSQRFQDALASFRAGPTPEGGQRVASLVDPFLSAMAEQFARPSPEFRQAFSTAMGALQEIEFEAGRIETAFQDALLGALGEGMTIDKLIERNTALTRDALQALLEESRAQFAAIGFRLPALQEGTEFVPRTGPYLLHAGEAVVPADENAMGGVMISVTVNGAGNPEATGRAVARAIEQEVLTGRLGRAMKHRMRKR